LIIFGCKSRKTDQAQIKSGTDAKKELSGNFTIGGAYALYPLVSKWADDFMKIHPSVKIVVNSTGTGKGIEDLIFGKNLLAMVSRPIADDEYNEGIWIVPVAKDGVAAIVNQDNPYLNRIIKQGLSPNEFLKVFTSDKPITWGELLDTAGKDNAIVYTRADESGAADVFANFLFVKSSDLKGTKVTGDNEMIENIQKHPLAIGYCNFSYAFDLMSGDRKKGIQIVPADLDYDNKIESKEIPFSNLEKAHRGLWLGLYPKNLCRELYIGSKGKPTQEAVVEFIKYILTEGQDDVKSSGLCVLNDVYIEYSLEKLK
jgi:phosphate transport system substrate-binding protein